MYRGCFTLRGWFLSGANIKIEILVIGVQRFLQKKKKSFTGLLLFYNFKTPRLSNAYLPIAIRLKVFLDFDELIEKGY